MTDSIITQEQLNQLFADRNEKLTLAEVENACVKVASSAADENSAAYHNIMDILRTASSRQEAAVSILEGINSLVQRKMADVIGELKKSADGECDTTSSASKTNTGLIRRR